MINLIIENKQKKYSAKFIEFLIIKAQEYTIDVIKDKRFEAFDFYLKNNLRSERIITTKEIILSGIYSLIYTKYSDKYIISIDKDQILYSTDYHLIDICKLINYGNLEITGTYIFSNIFDHMLQNINVYYQIYLNYS